MPPINPLYYLENVFALHDVYHTNILHPPFDVCINNNNRASLCVLCCARKGTFFSDDGTLLRVCQL